MIFRVEFICSQQRRSSWVRRTTTDEDYDYVEPDWDMLVMMGMDPFMSEWGSLDWNEKKPSQLSPEERNQCRSSCEAEVGRDYYTYGNLLCGAATIAALPSGPRAAAAGAGCLAALGFLKPYDVKATCTNRCGS